MNDPASSPKACPVHSCLASAARIAMVVILAAGIAAAGWMVREGLRDFRTGDRVVSVKGLAERDVEADLAVWNITHTSTGNALGDVQTESEKNQALVLALLRAKKFTDAEIEVKPLQAQDLLAQSYRPEGIERGRYIITQNVTIRTRDMAKLDAAVPALGDLLRQGVTLANTQPPLYFFTALNDIKPAMLAEATTNAREAATQFARQAQADVGRIKQASQGVFQIMPRDAVQYEGEQNQRYKKVRVVSTIDFYLR